MRSKRVTSILTSCILSLLLICYGGYQAQILADETIIITVDDGEETIEYVPAPVITPEPVEAPTTTVEPVPEPTPYVTVVPAATREPDPYIQPPEEIIIYEQSPPETIVELTPEPTPSPTPEPTPKPTPSPTPRPVEFLNDTTAPVVSVSSYDGYSNEDIDVVITAEDPSSGGYRSGIETIEYTVTSKSKETEAGTFNYSVGTESATETVTINGLLNSSDDVIIKVVVTDYSGNSSETSASYMIDAVKPLITGRFDRTNKDDSPYYVNPRTLYLSFTEEYFSEEDIIISIAGNSYSPEDLMNGNCPGVSITKLADTSSLPCTKQISYKLIFEGDSRYEVSASLTDEHGNTGTYSSSEFIVDSVAPLISVSPELNSEAYLSGTGSININITESNLDVNGITIEMTGKTEEDIENIKKSETVSEDNVHSFEIPLTEDGEYVLTVKCTDILGNESEVFETGTFIVDNNAPELIFTEPSEGEYCSDVSPQIEFSDKYLDLSSLVIEITGKDSENIDSENITELENSYRYNFEDIENDGKYTIKASVKDLAGNITEKEISFVINKLGAVFSRDEKTENLSLNSGFTNDVSEGVVIYAEDLSEITSAKITLRRDSELYNLTEGNGFTKTVKEENNLYNYEFIVDKSYFENEGYYDLVVVTEDAAGNVNMNSDAPISFGLDTTLPSCLITGAEDEGRYNSDEVDLKLISYDENQLSGVKVYIDDIPVIEKEENEIKFSELLTIKSSTKYQSIRLEATDIAGNTEVSEIKILVTTNILIHFFNNRLLFISSVIVVLTVLISGIVLIHLKNKSDEDELI